VSHVDLSHYLIGSVTVNCLDILCDS